MTGAIALAAALAHPREAAAGFLFRSPMDNRTGVVKIYVTTLRPDFSMPWKSGRPVDGTGSGFIIPGRRILTNAHLAGDARFIQVQKDGDAERYVGRVAFVAHDCDLAEIVVDDKEFFEGTRPLTLADRLPELDDEVMVLGYPLGGERLSVTRGVVSRLGYATYAHSGIDNHLVLQVDAAINPGNSGGPVLFNNRVVGIAFQGMTWAENIGYAIPQPVIAHFLKDVEDGTYNGYPELGIEFLSMRNDAMRKSLSMPDDLGGVVVFNVDPYGAGHNRLLPADVLLAINGHPIANDGIVLIGDEKFQFSELIERCQWGERVTFDVWRGGRKVRQEVKLDNPPDPFVYRNTYDTRPAKIIAGGLVFSTLSRDFLKTLQRDALDANVQRLFYISMFAKDEKLTEGRDEFVVLIKRLAHPVNTYLERYVNGVVTEVNGKPIRRLADISTALGSPTNGFHVIRFMDNPDVLVMDADAAKKADGEIRTSYGIARENGEELPK